jgi:hypothetical protein
MSVSIIIKPEVQLQCIQWQWWLLLMMYIIMKILLIINEWLIMKALQWYLMSGNVPFSDEMILTEMKKCVKWYY